MALQCPSCSRMLGPRERFCRNCGTAGRTGTGPTPLSAADPFAQLDASLRGSTIPNRFITAPPLPPLARPAADRRPLAVALLLIGVLAVVALFGVAANQGQPPIAANVPAGPQAVAPITTGNSSVPSTPVSPVAAAPGSTSPNTVNHNPASAVTSPPTEQQQTAAPLQAPAPVNSSPAASSMGPQDAIARVKASTVLILSKLPNGVASGTGFVVGPHQIGTCAHVVADAEEIVIVFADGQHTEAIVASSDSSADVALLNCSVNLPPALPLGSYSDVREGDEIAVTGYPKFFDLAAIGMAPVASTTRGYVSAKRERQLENGTVPEIQIDASVNHGNSGGPVYRTSDGVVVALAAATIADSQGLNFATPVDALRRLMGSG